MKFKWNRKLSIFVLFMFITVTFASFNTNLFINGKAYVRVDEAIRIVDIHLLDTEYDGYETMDPEFNKNEITMDANLPKQNSSVTYQVSIQNTYPYDYDITDIIEELFTNEDVSYQIIGVNQNTIIPKNSTTTFTIKFTNNKTITEEEDVYETKTYTFDYTGDEQEFIVPFDGDYTLEVWGAQGGNATADDRGGYGAYSKGTIHLRKNQVIYINVGGQGNRVRMTEKTFAIGGYNGGGDAKYNGDQNSEGYNGSGGGATHIATVRGKLEELENNKDHVIIVAGAGGGGVLWNRIKGSGPQHGIGGDGGGIQGNDGYTSANHKIGHGGNQTQGGTQTDTESGTFGKGGKSAILSPGGAGGGAGWYGGSGSSDNAGAGGGSGYIGNTNLTNKAMYCYQCTESTATETKTITTDNHSQNPTANYAKEGNGYAKITFTRKIEDGSEYNFDYTGGEQIFTVPYTGIYELETWGAQGGQLYNVKYNYAYGGYSSGLIELNKNQVLYVNVGGTGTPGNIKNDTNLFGGTGGYNGGGNGGTAKNVTFYSGSGGGGATHIAKSSGQLSSLENNKNDIIIVSGGGGGAAHHQVLIGGSGGGIQGGGNDRDGDYSQYNYIYLDGANQTTGYLFGQGQAGRNATDGSNGCEGNGGGGGGYYGGLSVQQTGEYTNAAGTGGSGYIGNAELYEKIMYCFNCVESQNINTRTVSTKSHSKLPKQNIPKEGNGYSRITLLKRKVNNAKLKLKFEFARHLYDYTITYDDNYLDNDEFYDHYNSFTYARCCGTASDIDQFPISGIVDEHGVTVTANKKETDTGTVLGYYFGAKSGHPLEVGEKYEYTFEAKGNKDFTGNIGAEQGGRILFDITTSWHKYKHEFTADDYQYKAFTMYTWGLVGDNRILYLRNYQIHKYHENDYPQYQATETQPIGENIAPTPYRDGWTFLGWYDDPIEGNEINANTVMPSENTTYYAHWEQVHYSINYDLESGVITNAPTEFYSLNNTKIIPNPTKTGYTFTGWTGGKSIFSYDYIYNNQHLGTGSTSATSGARGLFDVKPNTYYTLSTNLPLRPDNGKYVIMKASDDFNDSITSTNNGASAGNTITVKSTANGHIIIAFFKSMMSLDMQSKLETGEYWFQIEEGQTPTKFESYIETPQKDLNIPYYSTGNRNYKANWVKDYDIEYDLDGGTITGQPTTYNEETDTFTIPTPTKEGYTFTGWTGGKNLFDKTNPNEATVFINIAGTTAGVESRDRSIYVPVKSNTTYTISYPENVERYRAFSVPTIVDSQVNNLSGINRDGEKIITITTGPNDKYLYVNFQVDCDLSYYYDGLQIEEGEEVTAFEKHISTPTKNITIPTGSTGNRTYKANWIKNYQLDVNHFEDGEWIDRTGSSDPRYTNLKFDVYINGQLRATQVHDFNQYYIEGTTYELTNFTYDTDAFDLIVGNNVNTGSTVFNFNNPISGTLSQSLVNTGTESVKVNIELRAKS